MCAPPDFADLLARVGVPMVPAGHVGARAGARRARQEAVDTRRCAAGGGGVGRRAVRDGRRGGRGMRRAGGVGLMPQARERWPRCGASPMCSWRSTPGSSSVAASRAAVAAGQAVSAGRDRQPGAVGRGRRAGAGAVRCAAQRPSGGARPATGGQRPRPRLHRSSVAGGGPDPVPVAGSPDLDVVQTGAWILADERPLPADLEAFLDAGTPPVYVGFGSVRAPEDAARVAIEAIRAQGRRAVLARGWADLAPIDDRDDCFVVGEVNQQALFDRVAAVVHHGGAGTTTTAARAGAPQVVVPQIADQPYWAGRVADLGIGAAHDGPTPTFESLSAALSTALTPETRARATAVAGTIRTDGAAVAAKLLLEAVSRERPVVSA